MNSKELQDFYKGKTVLITGHTGFKGSWLSHTLLSFGAKVVGVSLAPKTPNDIFVTTGLQKYVEHNEFDIRYIEKVRKLMKKESPDVVFHLAAQALVRQSYDEPLLTVTTNVIGTTNILEAVRLTPSVSSVVIITTDKVYENKEWIHGYREEDPLGGHDPYSASKAAADIVSQAYSQSFFNPKEYGKKHRTLVGIARAGNVIGGGDWSENRLIPDIMRTVLSGDGKVVIRSPNSIRPWEHVLEPISGYLMLGMHLANGEREFASTWNFGPDKDSWLSVGVLTKRMLKLLNKGVIEISPDNTKREAGLLTLDTIKAYHQLRWRSQWGINRTLKETARWYTEAHNSPKSAKKVTQEQIADYFNIKK